MYKNYQILFNHIEELTTMVKKAEEISDRFPYVFVFAIGNLKSGMQGTTEYKIFSRLPADLKIKLQDDKFEKFTRILQIPNESAGGSSPGLQLSSSVSSQLTEAIEDISYYCKTHDIPAFMAAAYKDQPPKNNEDGAKSGTTKYYLDLVSPLFFGFDLYDDRLTPMLRYTLETEAYPDLETILVDDAL